MPSRPNGSAERLIPKPMTKIACDLWSQELLLRGSSRATIWLEKKSLSTKFLVTTSQPFN